MRGACRGLWLALGFSTAAGAGAPPGLELQQFASGLSSPLAVRHAPDGSGQVHVVQRNGVIRSLDAAGNSLGTLLDFSANPPPQGFSTGGGGDERGLLGLAFHPDFPDDPRLFVNYTDGNSDTVIASYTASGSPPVANPASATILLRVDQDFSNHNGGDLHFGADHYLYIGMGDGGSGNDPCNRAQTLDPASLVLGGSCSPDAAFQGNNPESLALLGKMLRIDVDATTPAGHPGTCGGNADGSANYAIPAGNPVAGGGTADGCDEVWHYGLRNPYRFSFDRATGDMYIGDVGQSAWEEVDFAAVDDGGLNFGWRVCEGRFVTGSTSNVCNLAGATPPILDYGRSGGACAVTGGFVYRGPIAALQGNYIYADYCNGRISIATRSGGSWSSTLWQDAPYSIAGFGEDEAGNLYLTDFFGGRVFRFTVPGTGEANDDVFQLDEDAGASTLDVLANDTGEPLQIVAVGSTAHGSVANLGTAVSYTPDPDYCGTDGFDYTLDGGSSATVLLDIQCIEDGDATAVDDAIALPPGSEATPLDVLANDLPDPDPEQNPVAIVAVSAPAHGSASHDAGLAYYTPDAGFCGEDAFTYTIAGGSSASVAITVQCAVAVDDHAQVVEDSVGNVVDVLANDGPAPVTIVAVTAAAHGNVQKHDDHLRYTPAPDFCGSDGFGYTISGGSTASVSVQVDCVEDGPALAADDVFLVPQDAAATVLDVLANDGMDPDPEQNPISVAQLTAANPGTATLDGGQVRYAPAPGHCGFDSFQYTLAGGGTAAVIVQVACTPPPAIFANGFE